MKPRQPQNWNDNLREVQTALAGQEAMYGDLRAAKGAQQLGVEAVAPKRQRAPSLVPTEHAEQKAVIQWWAWHCTGYGLPSFALFAIPNGGNRDAITGAMLKAEGVRAGIPDLMLAKPNKFYFGLFIELKRLNTYANPAQRAVGAYLNGAAYRWVVCQGADAAIAEIKAYLG